MFLIDIRVNYIRHIIYLIFINLIVNINYSAHETERQIYIYTQTDN